MSNCAAIEIYLAQVIVTHTEKSARYTIYKETAQERERERAQQWCWCTRTYVHIFPPGSHYVSEERRWRGAGGGDAYNTRTPRDVHKSQGEDREGEKRREEKGGGEGREREIGGKYIG